MFCNEKVTCNKQPLPLPHAMLLLDFHTQPHKSFHRYFTHFPTTKCRQPFLLCHAIGKKRLSTFSNLQHFHATTVISCNKRLYIAICCNSIFSFLFWNFIHFLLSAVLFLATPRIAACNALFFCTQHWHRLFSSAYRHNRSVDAKSMHFRLIYVLFCRLTAAGCTVLATRCGQTTQAKYNKWQRCGAAAAVAVMQNCCGNLLPATATQLHNKVLSKTLLVLLPPPLFLLRKYCVSTLRAAFDGLPRYGN